MAKLVDLGFRFSIDRVSNVEIDLPDLERAGVKYIKISAQTLTEQIVRQGLRPRSAITREIAAADISAIFQRYGIDLIAERIENEQLVLEALDLEAPFGQGIPSRATANQGKSSKKPSRRARCWRAGAWPSASREGRTAFPLLTPART